MLSEVSAKCAGDVCGWKNSNTAIICKTLKKKKGCAFQNIGYFTNIVVSVPLISLAFYQIVSLFYS